MKKNLPVTDKEYDFSASINILSTTDLKGGITHVNKDFIEVSGFEEKELLGKNHNMVRHPDMPPAAFQDLWDTIKAGHSWMGLVKNRRKNGDFYWVDAFVTPITHNDKVIEFQSVRTRPSRANIARAEKAYGPMMQGKGFSFGLLGTLSLRSKMWIGMVFAMAPLLVTSLFQLGALASLIALLASFTIGTLIVSRYLKPFRELVNESRAIVDNKLMQYVYTGRGDEIGLVSLAIKKMKSEARAIIGRMEDVAQQLKELAKEMDSSVALANQEVSHQEREINHVVEALSQMSSTIMEIAANASDASDAAHRAEAGADEGKRVVQASIGSIERVAGEVDRVYEAMNRLVDQSSDISGIVTVIQDISEQTNLLALNAAIEAARAGEQGRGFAVVADEVRTLASRTQESTKEIQSKIERLQMETQNAAKEIEESKASAASGVEQAAQAGKSLDQITEAVSAITSMNSMIASSTEEQRATAEGINTNVQTIAEVAEMTADGVGYTSQLMGRVNTMAEQLGQLAGQFRKRRTVAGAGE